MRHVKFLAVFVSLIFATSASAQDAYRDMTLDTAMEIHAGITAGWLIGKRCKLLKPDELSELDKESRDHQSEPRLERGVFPRRGTDGRRDRE